MAQPARRRQLIVGTAGHIDHGKSSLVKVLTGTDPDRLDEEKKRGITIELGFAQLTLPDGTSMGVVDVPGHERFVKQMIAGSTGIDIALFCIAADDGIMPQTIEHKAILEVLGVRHSVVALTKIDLVDEEWVDMATQEISSFFADGPYADAPIIPVSSHTGQGLDTLAEALVSVAENTSDPVDDSFARMPIDRAFTIKGSGTVVTGTLWSGVVRTDDLLELFPSELQTRVRSIQVHGQLVDEAQAGNRVALNLNAVSIDEVSPGNFLATPKSIIASDRFDAAFTYLDAAKRAKPLKSGSRVHVAHGTKEVIGRILFMNGKELLTPNEVTFAQIRLEEPLSLLSGDHFVVRSYSPVSVIGGGTVLLAHPRHRTNITETGSHLLESLLDEDQESAIRAAFKLEHNPVIAHKISLQLDIPVETVRETLDVLCQEGKAVSLVGGSGTTYYTTRALQQKIITRIENSLVQFHNENPSLPGISKKALHQLADGRMELASFEAFLTKAKDEGKVLVADGLISHPKAGGSAKQLEEQTAETLLAMLEEAGSKPPAISELAATAKVDTSVALRALGRLEKNRLVKRIGNEWCFTQEALDGLEKAVRCYLAAHETATAAELKDAMQSSRKYAIPLLEFFDAQGITIREGDKRRLKK